METVLPHLFKMRMEIEGDISERPVLENAEQAGDWLRPYFRGEYNEVFFAVYLSNDMHLIGVDRHAEGNLFSVVSDMRSLFGKAYMANARYIVVAHNHPGVVGFDQDHENDVNNFKVIREAGNYVGIELLDALIFDEVGSHFSLSKHVMTEELSLDFLKKIRKSIIEKIASKDGVNPEDVEIVSDGTLKGASLSDKLAVMLRAAKRDGNFDD